MLRACAIAGVLLACLFQLTSAWSEEGGARAPAIEALIAELGAPEWRVREAARRRLLGLGDTCLPYLERARGDRDPEVAARAAELVLAIRWQVPEELIELSGPIVEDFGGLSEDERLAVLDGLATVGDDELRPLAGFFVKVVRYGGSETLSESAVALYRRAVRKGAPKTDELMLSALAPLASSWRKVFAARLEWRLGRAKRARALLNPLISAGASAEVVAFYRRLLVELRAFEELLPLARAAVVASPKLLVAQLQLAECLFDLGRTEEGRVVLARAEQLTAHKLDDLLALSGVHQRRGDLESAERILSRALLRFPFRHEVAIELAAVEARQGQTRRALERYLSELRFMVAGTREAKRLRSGLEVILEGAGCAWFARSEDFWQDLFRGRPVARAHRRVARWLEDRGLMEAAILELRLVALLADDVGASLRLGRHLKDRGQVEELNDLCASLRLRHPENRELSLGIAKLQRGLTKTAVGSLGGAERGLEEAVASSAWDHELPVPGTSVGREAGARFAFSLGVRGAAPLLADRVVFGWARGSARLFALALTDRSELWSVEPALVFPDGRQPARLEPVAALCTPAAVVMRLAPERAFEAEPLYSLVFNAWRNERGVSKDDELGLYVVHLEPGSGEVVAFERLKGAKPARVAHGQRGCRLVIESLRSEARQRLQIVDLAAGRSIESIEIRAREIASVALRKGSLRVLSERGLVDLSWPRLAPSAHRELPGAQALLAVGRFVHARSRLFELGADLELEGKEITLPNCSAGLTTLEDGALVAATREGRVVALEPGVSRLRWERQLERAARRRFYVADGLLLSVQGCEDRFVDEVPSMLVLSSETGATLWKRPLESAIRVANSERRLAVLMAAGAGARLVVIERASRDSTAASKARGELRRCALDALEAGEAEVGVLTYRHSIGERPTELLSATELLDYARLLAGSRRPLLAEDMLARAAVKAGPERAGEFRAWRVRLGFEQPLPADAVPAGPR